MLLGVTPDLDLLTIYTRLASMVLPLTCYELGMDYFKCFQSDSFKEYLPRGFRSRTATPDAMKAYKRDYLTYQEEVIKIAQHRADDFVKFFPVIAPFTRNISANVSLQTL